jgi:hypothetical protein
MVFRLGIIVLLWDVLPPHTIPNYRGEMTGRKEKGLSKLKIYPQIVPHLHHSLKNHSKSQ